MKKMFVGLLSFLTLEINAQVPVIEWQKCYGGSNYEDAWCLINTSDSGYLFSGDTYSNNGSVFGNHGMNDLWVVKSDGTGNLQWQICLGGTNDDLGTKAIQVSDGGYLISGATNSNDGDVSGNHGGSDTWVIKLDSMGSIQWQKCFGGSSYEDRTQSIIETNDHDFIITSSTLSNDGDVSGNHDVNFWDIWIIKIDNNGSLLLQKCIGGTQNDHPTDLFQTREGNFLLTAEIHSSDGDITTTTYGGWTDFWISLLDTNLNIIWQSVYGGSGDDLARSAKQTRDGGFVIGGSTTSNDFDVSGNHSIISQDYWLIKIDSTGDLQWQKCLGGMHFEDAFSIDTTLDGGILIAGISESEDGDITAAVDTLSSNWWVVKLDSVGTILWDKSLGGSDQEEAQAIRTTPDGGCIILGYTSSNDLDVTGGGYHGGQDFWAVKLSSTNVGIFANQNLVTDFTLYLAPVTNNLTLNFFANGNERIQLQLLDMTGRVLLSKPLGVTEGFNQQEVHVGSLSAGMYIVRLATECGSVSKKLVTQ
ncbi:MAG: T9SS type A sorting domain-containing protein [Bacteroidota bacterium]